MKPVAYIDLFCGMGGFSLGARNAGATCILAVDSWEEAIDVHRANFPKDSIRNFKLGMNHQIVYFETLTRRWMNRGYHVHIHGSPPCQALSNASRRDASEGMPLVLWFLRLIHRCEPDSWSMENVVPVRKRLPEGTPSTVLNSADFGVPQTRRRCFAGSGWEATITHAKDDWVSVIDALPHLADELQDITGLMDSGRSSAKTTGVNPATGRKEGGSGPLFRELTEPSYTQMSSPRVIKSMSDKPQKVRSLTLPETLVLQGFPSDFSLESAKTQKSRWTMVGNAVCPPVAEALIRGIHDEVDD